MEGTLNEKIKNERTHRPNRTFSLTLIAIIISCAVMLISIVTSVFSNLDGKIAREEVWKIEKRIERMVNRKHDVLILQLEGIRKQQQNIILIISGLNRKKIPDKSRIPP